VSRELALGMARVEEAAALLARAQRLLPRQALTLPPLVAGLEDARSVLEDHGPLQAPQAQAVAGGAGGGAHRGPHLSHQLLQQGPLDLGLGIDDRADQALAQATDPLTDDLAGIGHFDDEHPQPAAASQYRRGSAHKGLQQLLKIGEQPGRHQPGQGEPGAAAADGQSGGGPRAARRCAGAVRAGALTAERLQRRGRGGRRGTQRIGGEKVHHMTGPRREVFLRIRADRT
jgi:hypothetical protein